MLAASADVEGQGVIVLEELAADAVLLDEVVRVEDGPGLACEPAVDVLVVEIVEAVLVDFVARAEVPLADLRGGIAGLLEVLGYREFFVEAGEVTAVGFDPEAVLVLSDHQAGT